MLEIQSLIQDILVTKVAVLLLVVPGVPGLQLHLEDLELGFVQGMIAQPLQKHKQNVHKLVVVGQTHLHVLVDLRARLEPVHWLAAAHIQKQGVYSALLVAVAVAVVIGLLYN